MTGKSYNIDRVRYRWLVCI